MRKKNIPYIISYGLALLIALLATVFYRQSLLAVLFLLMLLLPVLSVALTIHAAKKIELQALSPSNAVTVPSDINILLKVNNPGLLPMLNLELMFSCENLFYPDGRDNTIVLPAEARRKLEFTIPVYTALSGLFTMDIKEVFITDYLHLYTVKTGFRAHLEIPVLPADTELPRIRLTKTASENEDSEPSPEGEPGSDIRELREYRPGDRLKDIHWKMSARSDDILVKEYERSRELYYLLLPELEDGSAEANLSLFYALGKKLIKDRESFRAAIYNPDDKSFELLKVSEPEDLDRALFSMYRMRLEKHSTALLSMGSQFPDRSGIILISKGAVTTTDAPAEV